MIAHYAGIGSRETPPGIIEQMKEFAVTAAHKGWILRSGGANGADTAFEQGCDRVRGLKEIFLPWKGFNNNDSMLYPPSAGAVLLAAEIHPAHMQLSRAAKLLLARNMHQILGRALNVPVICVVCYTKDGCESIESYGKKTGGTGSAIALASVNNVPIFNLVNPNRYNDALLFIETHS